MNNNIDNITNRLIVNNTGINNSSKNIFTESLALSITQPSELTTTPKFVS